MSSKKILVTGGTGFLGSHLVCAMVQHGYAVSVLKRKASDMRRLATVSNRITTYDVEDRPLSRPFEDQSGFDAVIHAATCYGRKGETASKVFHTNTEFPLQLLEASVLMGTKLFLNTDTALPHTLNAYALSKKQFSDWGRHYAKEPGILFLNVVLEHMYGPGDDRSKFTTHVIRSCYQNVPELQLTAGEQQRDFIYISDVIAAFLLLLEKFDVGQNGFQQFTVGSGQPVSIRKFVNLSHSLTNSTTRLLFGALPYRPNEIMQSSADINAMRALGWIPKVSLQEGISRILEEEKTT
jgi:CDP-paratose synthetase